MFRLLFVSRCSDASTDCREYRVTESKTSTLPRRLVLHQLEGADGEVGIGHAEPEVGGIVLSACGDAGHHGQQSRASISRCR